MEFREIGDRRSPQRRSIEEDVARAGVEVVEIPEPAAAAREPNAHLATGGSDGQGR
ncbi:hypothetical protein IQ279_03260 [Streptomyces verrucosisporus]|uniref:hypothetical protein n=1 Tax=Streptomyces verrucosisporus TaxID=1695161 RepID=UPI0019D09664|nr:hypothetical protein [Streptomyces verrucosisporus]MBN3928672.1 hypothetical protein [Streptomyces verrucosisporus]